MWPRAESKLFEEPKKLVEHDDAKARAETIGRRPRTVYSITSKGRSALATWLAVPGDGPMLEFEGLVKLMFAEHGSRTDAPDTIARARAWAVEMNAANIAAAIAVAEGEGRLAERRATTLLVDAFLTDFYTLVARWADRATAEGEHWPDDIASHRTPPEVTRAVLARDRLTDTPAKIVTELGETLRQTPPKVALVGDWARYTGPSRSNGFRWFTDPSTRDIYIPEDHEFLSRMYAAGLRCIATMRGPGSRRGGSARRPRCQHRPPRRRGG